MRPDDDATTGRTRSSGTALAAGARRAVVPAVLAVAAVALILATDGVARVIGWGLLGVAIVVAISLVFLEIGYSEDRSRARGS